MRGHCNISKDIIRIPKESTDGAPILHYRITTSAVSSLDPINRIRAATCDTEGRGETGTWPDGKMPLPIVGIVARASLDIDFEWVVTFTVPSGRG